MPKVAALVKDAVHRDEGAMQNMCDVDIREPVGRSDGTEKLVTTET